MQVKLLHPDAKVPEYKSAGASGFDLTAMHAFTVYPTNRVIVSTGLGFAIPPGLEGQVRARSGFAARTGLIVVNAPGTIDSDYRGEVKVILCNPTGNVVNVDKGERIAQMIIAPVSRAWFDVVDELDETVRGEGGFGSTGTS